MFGQETLIQEKVELEPFAPLSERGEGCDDELQPILHVISRLDGYGESTTVIPNQVRLLRIENIAIPACYLTVGVVQGLTGPLLNVYPLNLGATEAAQVTLSTIVSFPSIFKILYGFLSDSVPICGMRRKPYMILGWIMVTSAMAALILMCDLSMSYDDSSMPVPPKAAPSIKFLSGMFFLLGVGLWLADVTGDSLVVCMAVSQEYRIVLYS